MNNFGFQNKDGSFKHENFGSWEAAWTAAVTAAQERDEPMWVFGYQRMTVRFNPRKKQCGGKCGASRAVGGPSVQVTETIDSEMMAREVSITSISMHTWSSTISRRSNLRPCGFAFGHGLMP